MTTEPSIVDDADAALVRAIRHVVYTVFSIPLDRFANSKVAAVGLRNGLRRAKAKRLEDRRAEHAGGDGLSF